MGGMLFKHASSPTAKTVVAIAEEDKQQKFYQQQKTPNQHSMLDFYCGGDCGVEVEVQCCGEEEEEDLKNAMEEKNDADADGSGLWVPMVEQDLASEICRHFVGTVIVGILAMVGVQYLYVVAMEERDGSRGSNGRRNSGFCLGRGGGVSSGLWVFGVLLLVLMMFWRVIMRRWRRRKEACFDCHDVEESRSRAEDADRRAQKAQRSKQEFMAYVFHNIRVPFNAIVLGLGYLRATEDEKTSSADVKERMDLVKLMLDCAETMTNVLNDVTDLGQDEVGTLELHMEEFDLLAVLRFLIWGLKDLISHKNVSFNMDIKPMVESLLTTNHVVGDKHRVVQTLGIFLSNAVKFTPIGGTLELKVNCEETLENSPNNLPCWQSSLSSKRLQHCPVYVDKNFKVANVVLSVRDFVTGMSSPDPSRLCEPYSLATLSVPKSRLSGSGLSMAKRFAEQAGGYIGLMSINSKERAFCLSIPYLLVPVDRHAESDTKAKDVHKSDTTNCKPMDITHDGLEGSSQSEPKTQRGRNIKFKSSFSSQESGLRRRVLLVEDTEINRIILRKVLQNLNLHCEEAENGKIAVDYFKQGRTYDLVLMDKEMPVMDGHEATRQLRTMGVKTPIIALTGNALQSDKDLFFEAGVDDFQTKPLSRDKLVQLLARYGVESSCGDNNRSG